jgi:hypothetical protein
MTGLGGRGNDSTGTRDLREVSKSGGQGCQQWLRSHWQHICQCDIVQEGGEARRLRDLTRAGNESETRKPTVSWSLPIIKSERQTVINTRWM